MIFFSNPNSILVSVFFNFAVFFKQIIMEKISNLLLK